MTVGTDRDVELLDIDDGEAGQIVSELMRSALTMVKDPAEAEALVALTLVARDNETQAGVSPSRTRLFRLLRETYHSVDRSRGLRRARGALAVSLAVHGEAAVAADAA